MLKKTVALFLLFLLGCGQFKPQPIPPRIAWIIAFDLTLSIPYETFNEYKNNLFPQLVLANLRGKDEIHILPFADKPPEVLFFDIKGRGRFLEEKEKEIRERIKGLNQMKRRTITNIGEVIAYAKKISRKRGEDFKYVLIIFSDGIITGNQTLDKSRLDGGISMLVYFIGVKDVKQEMNLISLCKKMGIDSKVSVVPLTSWEAELKDFGLEFGRRPNPAILKKLKKV